MLRLDNINLSLEADEGTVRVLKDINLHLEKGKSYAFTGPNGSGKSTAARVIMGISPPTGGKVWYQGEDITGLGITERARRGIGYAFQHPPRFKGMQVRDLLEVALNGGSAADCQSLRQIGLCPDAYLERPLDASLSGGEIKRIEIATLLAQDPRLRIFDEPEAGIDLWSFEQLIDVIFNAHREDTTTVIISHQEKILNLVDEIVLIEEGGITMKGEREKVWPQIKESTACACLKNCTKEGELYADTTG